MWNIDPHDSEELEVFKRTVFTMNITEHAHKLFGLFMFIQQLIRVKYYHRNFCFQCVNAELHRFPPKISAEIQKVHSY